MKQVKIENGIVVEADLTAAERPDMIEAPDNVYVGFLFDGTNFTQPPAPIPTEADIRTEGARRLAVIGLPYSAQERETWPQQVAEAKAVLADTNAPTPLLSAIAAGDNIPVTDLATTIIQKADAFSAAAGAVLAAQRVLLEMTPYPTDYAAPSRWPALN